MKTPHFQPVGSSGCHLTGHFLPPCCIQRRQLSKWLANIERAKTQQIIHHCAWRGQRAAKQNDCARRVAAVGVGVYGRDRPPSAPMLL
ncbi:MAG: hypothetical protein KJ069_06350 [Anaerolineae bacterium]|nr:hypothetical protein [Anaerolineae bacterium]